MATSPIVGSSLKTLFRQCPSSTSMPFLLDFHLITSQRILEPIPLKPWVSEIPYFFQHSVPEGQDHLVLLGFFWIQDAFIHS